MNKVYKILDDTGGKCKVIDIELSDFMYRATDDPTYTLEKHVFTIVNHHVLKNIENSPNSVLILTTWCEEYGFKNLEIIEKSVKIIKNNFSFNVVVLIGEQHRRITNVLAETVQNMFKDVEHYFIYGFPFRFYTKIFEHKISEPSDTYVKNSENKFLLLIGKPHKAHRIRLLYKLFKKDLLKHCLWRFKIHNENVNAQCRELMKDISDEEYNEFLSKCERELDDVSMEYKADSSHYSGIPFERWIWDTCAFQVIPEVDAYANFPSEKTWIAVINKIPFITIAEVGHNKYLRHLGLETFEKYLLHKTYNDYRDNSLDVALDEIVENIEYWVNNIDKFYEELKIDVENNFDAFMKLVNNDTVILKSLIEKYKIDCKPEDLVVGYYA